MPASFALFIGQHCLQTSEVVEKHDTGVSGGLEKSLKIMARNYGDRLCAQVFMCISSFNPYYNNPVKENYFFLNHFLQVGKHREWLYNLPSSDNSLITGFKLRQLGYEPMFLIPMPVLLGRLTLKVRKILVGQRCFSDRSTLGLVHCEHDRLGSVGIYSML